MDTKRNSSIAGTTKTPTKSWAAESKHTSSQAAKSLAPGKTRITVKYDVGFSNSLYLRGEGAGLTWNKGVKLKNIKSDEWVWETDHPFVRGEFKVLVNDTHYEVGGNHKLVPGANLVYTPNF